MKSKVFFIAVSEKDALDTVRMNLSSLLSQSRLFDVLKPRDNVVIKMHFGEEGNTGYVRPEYVRVIYDRITHNKALAVVADTNTLYKGRRTNSVEHKNLAYEHGFTQNVVGAQVVIPDDTRKENTVEVPINLAAIKTAKVARLFKDAQVLVSVAHFKGHIMTGFGGALKNIGMGCATREGKLAQHSGMSPVIYQNNCIGCEACVKVCPVSAIGMRDKKAVLNTSICIGCASCIAACQSYAVAVDWEAGADSIQDKMIEYAKAVLTGVKGIFVNFATKITAECDCLAKDDPRIISDLGILVSNDPVSVDKACYDLALSRANGRDVFLQAHPNRDGTRQLRYAAELGLGSLDYELVRCI